MKPEELKEALLKAVNTICEEYAEDKPKFAVGDWVIHEDIVKQIEKEDEGYYFTDNSFGRCIKLWQPTEGDEVYVKDTYGKIHVEEYNGQTDIYPIIGDKTWLHKQG